MLKSLDRKKIEQQIPTRFVRIAISICSVLLDSFPELLTNQRNIPNYWNKKFKINLIKFAQRNRNIFFFCADDFAI